MSSIQLNISPLSKEHFAPFGDVVETAGAEIRLINQGSTERFHDLANIDVSSGGGWPIVSIFRGQPFSLPLEVKMMERHPLGSQLFFPLGQHPYLAVVAPDEDGAPGEPRVFHCPAGIGVNYARNTWHHPLISLHVVSDFMIVDRGGPGDNLEERDYPPARYRIDGSTVLHAGSIAP